MPALPAGDLTAIRTRPIGRDFTFYVYQPDILWIGTIGGAPSYGDTSLTVATDIGDITDLVADMTVRVTDAAGNPKSAPSKVRFKSQAGGVTLNIAENAIDWQAGDKVSGLRLFEIWPRIPYVDPSTLEQFKDADVAWTNDADAQRPKANGGPPAIATLGAGGTVDIIFKDVASYKCPTGQTIAAIGGTYQWGTYPAIGGGDPLAPTVVAGGLATSTVTLRFDTAGYLYVWLEVTDDNGTTNVVRIPVIIDDGTLPAIYNIPGDRSWQGNGYTLARRFIGLNALTGDSALFDGAPCFLVGDTDQTAETAFADNRANLRWWGWLSEDETKRTGYSRETVFRAVSTAHILENVPAFGTAFRNDATPADWYEFTDLCIDSVIHLLLDWHSTALQCTDAYMTGEWQSRPRPGEDCDAQDLLSQVNAVLAAVKGDLRCDRQGRLHAMRHEWFLSAAEEAARAVVLTLQNGDILEASYGPETHRFRVREVRASGVDGDSNPYLAGAPGPVPLDGGLPAEIQNLAPNTQAELNQWAAQQLSIENYPATVRLRMAGEYDCIDVAYGEYIAGSLSAYDQRIPDGPYRVVGQRFVDNQGRGYCLGEWELQPRPTMFGAEALDIPPETEPPDPPPPPLPPPPEPLKGTGDVVIVGTRGGGVCYTFDCITGVPPTWYQLNGGLADDSFIEDLCLNPLAPSFQAACIDATKEAYINDNWRAGDNWTLSLDQATALAWVPAASDAQIIQCYGTPYGRLVLAIVYHIGLVDWVGLAISEDWGTTWPLFLLNQIGCYFGGWVGATCSHSAIWTSPDPMYIMLPKSNGLPSGTLICADVAGADELYLCARNGFQRSQIGRIYNLASTAADYEPPCWVPSTHVPPPDCNAAGCNNALGGGTVLNREWNGPGAAALNRNDGKIYTRGIVYEDPPGTFNPRHDLWSATTGGLFAATQTLLGVDVGRYPLERRGMMASPPFGFASYRFIGLEIETIASVGYTHIYQDLDATLTPQKTIQGVWREIKEFPTIIDERGIMYLGRSATTSETATAGDTAVFYAQKVFEPALGISWQDKSGNLYSDLGAAGITAIDYDTESD